MQKEFSFPLNIDELHRQEQQYNLCADDTQLKTLKDILQVESVKSFEANFFLKLNNKEHLLNIEGEVKAELELQSVVSLENFFKTYEVPFHYCFDTKATYAEFKKMEELLGDATPDIIENGTLDLADLAIEQLSLAMEDYPRKPGETFHFKPEFDVEKTEQNKPFAVLERLKK